MCQGQVRSHCTSEVLQDGGGGGIRERQGGKGGKGGNKERQDRT